MLKRTRFPFMSKVNNNIYTGGLPNLTAATNAIGAAEDAGKWTSSDSTKHRGIPRRDRTLMTSIRPIHETSTCLVIGRNRCNNFNCNQYLLVSKSTNEGIFIDMCDDWADDWVGFAKEAGIKIRMVFMTHLHIDNMIGLGPLHKMMPDVPVAWNLAEKYWLEKFPDACRRYKRDDMVNAVLPMHRMVSSKRAVAANADFIQENGGMGTHNIFLTSMTTRSTSFIEFGDLALFYIYSPGHSMGHTMLHVPQEKLLFSGDLIGFDTIGRIDIPMGVGSMLGQSLRSLEELPDNTVVLPGHGKMTTLARERKCNKGLQRLYELMAAGKNIPSVGFNSSGWF